MDEPSIRAARLRGGHCFTPVEMDSVRATYPEAFEEAKQGDVSRLPEIHRRNRTEEDAVIMRMDPKLYKAAQEGDVKYLQEQEEILQRNRTEEVDSQDRRSEEFFLRRTQHGNNNILHIAARAGRDNFVAEALRDFPVLSDQVNSQGDSPLLVAARFGHLEVVKKLAETRSQIHEEMADTAENITNSSQTDSSQRDLEQGLADRQLDVQLRNSAQGTTALHEALRNGHEHVAQFLLRLKPEMATFDSHAGESPLFLAAESRCQDFVVNILRSGRAYSTKGPDGQNVLHAARNCDGRIISELLIKNNPELMRQLDCRGNAAIHYALEAECWVLLDQMLEADPSIALFCDAEGYTPLLRAASRGYLKICQAILQKCPESVEARNNQGQNALHLFKLWKKRDWEELFKIPEIRELLNIVDDEGNTPLHLALMENNKGKAIFFIGRPGIHLGAVNKQGLTALDLCESKWKQGTFVLLAIQGAPKGRLPKNEEVPVGGRDLKPFINTMTLVATLLATITFAAAFTMPGGFDTNPDNLGVAILIKQVSLKAFILADTVAMCSSMAVMFLLMWAMIAEKDDTVEELANVSSKLLPFALFATLVAFVCAIFAVIAPKALWVTILVGIICLCPIVSSSPVYLWLATIHLWVFEASAVLIRKYVEARKKWGNGNNSDHHSPT